MSKVETSKFLYELLKNGIYFIKTMSMTVDRFYFDRYGIRTKREGVQK